MSNNSQASLRIGPEAVSFRLPAGMTESVFETGCGPIHYWVSGTGKQHRPQLVFLPGLTADHRLFSEQIRYFLGNYDLLVWDAPGHAASWPFELNFSLADKAGWLDEILRTEAFDAPVLIGQSMGGYVAQAYAQYFPGKMKGFLSIDSAPLQKPYVSRLDLWILKRAESFYRLYPWNALVRDSSRGVAATPHGQALMRSMILSYDSDRDRYLRLVGHGYRILAEAYEKDLPYRISCPALLLAGKQDKAGSTRKLNRQWHEKTGIPIIWIDQAGHNANTDQPDRVNRLIEGWLRELPEEPEFPKKSEFGSGGSDR